MNIKKLKGKMVELDISIDKLAELLGKNKATIYRRFSKPETITIGEAMCIKAALNLSDEDASEIFLN